MWLSVAVAVSEWVEGPGLTKCAQGGADGVVAVSVAERRWSHPTCNVSPVTWLNSQFFHLRYLVHAAAGRHRTTRRAFLNPEP